MSQVLKSLKERPLTLAPDENRNLFQKKCSFCQFNVPYIDYKNLTTLKEYTNYYSKIKPRYYSGTCLKHQKMLSKAIKRARFMALVPYVT